MRGALFLTLVLGLAGSDNARPPAHSRELADALARRIDEFEALRKARKPPREKTVIVTEAELNAYLNLVTKMPPSLSGVDVRFDRERIAASGILDLDQLQGKVPSASLGGFSLFSGRMPVTLKGRLTSDDVGFGSLQFDQIQLGSIPIPVSVLEQIVLSATRTQETPNGFDILAPFRLPYNAKRIRLLPGRAILDF